ncbi:hypothetical protein BDP81DRAFT_438522 [Colletotrichum phormii]|uniref:Uncharacterized protein n=1 Tax=Colletotrichum phormii TaxID=359342 RepID=A0AAJ0E9X1_9PEZI|nr:uncharacterized protein BDP81DRAFT_438522 [Colletotrichum phormii]KAK1624016.1 hypothetical protein BDP81DRAFT_438522 [Colletotrichum phormii]
MDGGGFDVDPSRCNISSYSCQSKSGTKDDRQRTNFFTYQDVLCFGGQMPNWALLRCHMSMADLSSPAGIRHCRENQISTTSSHLTPHIWRVSVFVGRRVGRATVGLLLLDGPLCLCDTSLSPSICSFTALQPKTTATGGQARIRHTVLSAQQPPNSPCGGG